MQKYIILLDFQFTIASYVDISEISVNLAKHLKAIIKVTFVHIDFEVLNTIHCITTMYMESSASFDKYSRSLITDILLSDILSDSSQSVPKKVIPVLGEFLSLGSWVIHDIVAKIMHCPL